MKKKGIVLVCLLFLLTVAVVFVGYSYSNKQQEKLIHATTASTTEETTEPAEKKEKEQAVDITTYEENRDSLSIVEYLNYIQTVEKETAIAFYGQLPENATWATKAEEYLKEQVTGELTSSSLVSEEADSYELYITNTFNELAETNASVVFFMVPALGDQVRDISLVDSEDYLTRNVTSIKEVLPDALVVMVTPSPNSSGIEDYNSRMLDYIQYMENAKETAAANDWPVFDLHDLYLNKLEADNIELSATLEEDGYSLNSQGEELMSELFIEELSKPIDTTSGREE